MPVPATIAPEIDEVQTTHFYFSIIFQPVADGIVDNDSFTLANLQVSGSSDVSLSDFTLVNVQSNIAVVAVNLSSHISGSFEVDLIGNVTVGGVSETIDSVSKTIEYKTADIAGDTTFDAASPPTTPTEVELSLSAASTHVGGTVMSRWDFDFDFHGFNEDYLEVSPGTEKGQAVSIDEKQRCWLVPIRVPQSGEGHSEVVLPEGSISFFQSRKSAVVFYAAQININFNIPSNNDDETTRTFIAVINQDFRRDISITGNQIMSVDVRGLLRPFYHTWNPTTGVLSIRGRPTVFYTDLEFEVIVKDADTPQSGDGSEGVKATGKISVIDLAPAIVKPTNPLIFKAQDNNKHVVRINNRATAVNVKGTWLGLDHKAVTGGVEISGDVPEHMFGVNSGNFEVSASNRGGEAPMVEVPWEIQEAVIAPVIATITDVSRIVGYSAFTIQASLSEGTVDTWSITGAGGTISDTGLITIAAGRAVGTVRYTVSHTNDEGTDTEVFDFEVSAAPVAPTISAITDVSRAVGYDAFTIQASLSAGTTGGTWSITGDGATISQTGLITIAAGQTADTYEYTVSYTNTAGTDTETFEMIVSAVPPPNAPSINFFIQITSRRFFGNFGHPLSNPGTTYEVEILDTADEVEHTETVTHNSSARSYNIIYNTATDITSGTWTFRVRSTKSGVSSAWVERELVVRTF